METKVQVDANFLKQLGIQAIKNGTQDKFIHLAIEWAEQAEKTVLELKDELRKCNE